MWLYLEKWLCVLFFIYMVSSETFCPTVNTKGYDRRENRNKLTIMQYNVEWLFLDYYKNADCPGNGCNWKNSTISMTHLEYVADIINKYNPDIINLCEVEGCDELNVLSSKLSPNLKQYLIEGTDTSTGQNVGLLTKLDPTTDLIRSNETYAYPIFGSQCGYNGTGIASVTKHYITTFKLYDLNIAFISIHLIAYPDKADRCSKREAQAKIIEGVVSEYVKNGYEIIVLGDFNDYDKEVSDINNDMPISRVLDIIKGYDTNTYVLTNMNEQLIKTERYSNWWDKNGDCKATNDEMVLIDHILVTDGILAIVKNISIYHGYIESCDTLNSDHYPVILELGI